MVHADGLTERERQMSDEQDPPVEDPQVDEFEPITSQEEFEKRLGSRLQRERSKFSDYDQLKEQASKFQQLEDEKKTELEREREQREQLARENEALKLGKLRSDIAADKGVPAALLTGSTQEEIEAAAAALIEFRDGANGPRSPKPNPNQGRGGDHTPSGDWLRDSLSR
ncbi:hypothetical protein GS937_09560 [Rhodococcus hoagii]|nr:hypothetical protein [Prescottella equi]NKT71812.1 hypothetical protein [Prescottella equi]NKV67291.1 hypothetical protein [Prescottella equi]NKW15107.1 hypothetical protein [Prescottella equi]NKW64559.1 hypothetical protein [Prescottella equi]